MVGGHGEKGDFDGPARSGPGFHRELEALDGVLGQVAGLVRHGAALIAVDVPILVAPSDDVVAALPEHRAGGPPQHLFALLVPEDDPVGGVDREDGFAASSDLVQSLRRCGQALRTIRERRSTRKKRPLVAAAERAKCRWRQEFRAQPDKDGFMKIFLGRIDAWPLGSFAFSWAWTSPKPLSGRCEPPEPSPKGSAVSDRRARSFTLERDRGRGRGARRSHSRPCGEALAGLAETLRGATRSLAATGRLDDPTSRSSLSCPLQGGRPRLRPAGPRHAGTRPCRHLSPRKHRAGRFGAIADSNSGHTLDGTRRGGPTAPEPSGPGTEPTRSTGTRRSRRRISQGPSGRGSRRS